MTSACFPPSFDFGEAGVHFAVKTTPHLASG